LAPKIVVIGAGSASFGLNTLAALIRSPALRGAELALVDCSAPSLKLIGELAGRLNREWRAEMRVTTHQHHAEALEEADFVVLSIEVSPRERLWRRDYEIPLKHGVRQPYAENGGPGGFAHAARNIGPVIEIVRDMEKVCPEAWLINYTNPMVRICDAVNRYSVIRVAGLCHQIRMGYALVGMALAEDLDIQVPPGFTDSHASPHSIPARRKVAEQVLDRIQIRAAGLNHFTWMLGLHDRRTGEDLYPLFRQRWEAMPASFEPLTRQIFRTFNLFPIPGDEHLSEYLPWMSDPVTRPWDRWDLSLYDWDHWETSRGEGYTRIAAMVAGDESIAPLKTADSEGALEVIENISTAGAHYHEAINLPNRGQIPNLPPGAIVETPGMITGAGIHGVGVGELPDPVSELCRRELSVVRLGVDAAVNGDRRAALQCLLLDPVITDMGVAQNILDDYLVEYRTHLPQFWKD
jgi:alpha-galactosidase